MSALLGLLAQLLHVGLMLAASPVLAGLRARLRARLAGRAGPPVMQPWRDLLRLARKQPVIAEGTSPVFAAAPAGVLAANVAAAALVPSFALGMTTAPLADLLAIGGLLAGGAAVLALAGLEAGTAFGGIGASREMAFAAFAAPALLLAFFAVALLAGTTNLDAIAAAVRDGTLPAAGSARASLGLALLALLAVTLADDASGGAVRVEYSGRHLALLELALALRRLVWLALLVAAFAPFGAADASASPLAWLGGLAIWAAKLAVLATLLTLLEAGRARLRLARLPEFLGVAALLALAAVIFVFVSQGLA